MNRQVVPRRDYRRTPAEQATRSARRHLAVTFLAVPAGLVLLAGSFVWYGLRGVAAIVLSVLLLATAAGCLVAATYRYGYAAGWRARRAGR